MTRRQPKGVPRIKRVPVGEVRRRLLMLYNRGSLRTPEEDEEMGRLVGDLAGRWSISTREVLERIDELWRRRLGPIRKTKPPPSEAEVRRSRSLTYHRLVQRIRDLPKTGAEGDGTVPSEDLSFHPIAEMFPLLPEDDLWGLVDDICLNGLLDPIVLYEGKILDGRNRYIALGLIRSEVPLFPREPRFVKFPDELGLAPDHSPWEFVISKNTQRRDLKKDQKVAIVLDVLEGSDAWEAERRARLEEARQSRSEAAKAQPREGGGFGRGTGDASHDASPAKPRGSLLARQIARLAGTSLGTVERVRRLPGDLRRKVAAGEMRAGAAFREMRRREAGTGPADPPRCPVRDLLARLPAPVAALEGHPACAAESAEQVEDLARLARRLHAAAEGRVEPAGSPLWGPADAPASGDAGA